MKRKIKENCLLAKKYAKDVLAHQIKISQVFINGKKPTSIAWLLMETSCCWAAIFPCNYPICKTCHRFLDISPPKSRKLCVCVFPSGGRFRKSSRCHWFRGLELSGDKVALFGVEVYLFILIYLREQRKFFFFFSDMSSNTQLILSGSRARCQFSLT